MWGYRSRKRCCKMYPISPSLSETVWAAYQQDRMKINELFLHLGDNRRRRMSQCSGTLVNTLINGIGMPKVRTRQFGAHFP